MLNIFFFLLLFFTLAQDAVASPRDLPSLTVAAPSSLTEVVSDLARGYSARAAVSVLGVFGRSEQQEARIKAGEQIDIIITQDPLLIESLKRQGFLDLSSQTPLFRDALVVVAPLGVADLPQVKEPQARQARSIPLNAAPELQPLHASRSTLVEEALLLAEEARRQKLLHQYGDVRGLLLHRPLIMGDPATTHIGMLSASLSRALLLPDFNDGGVVRAQSSREILLQLEAEPSVAIAYRSDAMNLGFNNAESGYQLSAIDQKLYDAPRFEAFVVAGEHMDRARDFIAYLKTPRARKFFMQRHFEE
jgi:ABC-type molybdate transport system substrate-binding protein